MARLRVDPSDSGFPDTQTHQPQSQKPEEASGHALGHPLAVGLWQEYPRSFLHHGMQRDAAASAPQHKCCPHGPIGHLSTTLFHHRVLSLPTTPLPFLQEGKKAKRWLHTRSHPPDARIRRGLTDPPQGAPREMKPPMY